VTSFQKIAKRWGISAPMSLLIFNFSELKLRDLVKLWFFKLDYDEKY